MEAPQTEEIWQEYLSNNEDHLNIIANGFDWTSYSASHGPRHLVSHTQYLMEEHQEVKHGVSLVMATYRIMLCLTIIIR